MKLPARCNVRECQARRNLTKPILMYVRHPKCHMGGCKGLMYIDNYRLKNKIKDRNPAGVCYFDCYHHQHSKLSPNCKHREEAVMERNLSPKPKHSPLI